MVFSNSITYDVVHLFNYASNITHTVLADMVNLSYKINYFIKKKDKLLLFLKKEEDKLLYVLFHLRRVLFSSNASVLLLTSIY